MTTMAGLLHILHEEGLSGLLQRAWGRFSRAIDLTRSSGVNRVIKRENRQAALLSGVSTNPIMIFQMGRVGSKSVEAGVQHAYQQLSITVPVIHLHYLSNFEELERRARNDMPDTGEFMAYLRSAGEIRKSLEAFGDQKVNIISLVRDPVARNVSTFFYVLSEFIPDWDQKMQDSPFTVEDLHRAYLSKRSFVLTAMNWFEEQLEASFDIDVYATPFPKDAGYKIYSSSKANLLVIRLEDLDRCAGTAISQFLGLPEVKIGKVNTGDELKSGVLYRLFRTRPLPAEYVNWMYGFRLARHFYTEEELNSFCTRWTSSS